MQRTSPTERYIPYLTCVLCVHLPDFDVYTMPCILTNPYHLRTQAQEDPTPAAEAEPPCSRVSLTTHQVHLDYASFSAEEVLRQVFAPLRLEAPTSFETVDHVAHLNLRDAHLPYKRLIAQVILDKNAPRIRTVVNKLGSIQTQYRTFPLEVLAGESDLNVSVREAGATFRFNFAEVYWNSRLSTEHARLVNAVVAHFHASRPRVPLASCVVWDVFAGVGPFAIPLGLRGCVVHANDLNPRSHHYLVDNIARNKVGAYVTPYNRDGRDFLRERARQHQPVDHIIMNLPATALEFLDTFAAEREETAGEEEGRSRGLFDYLEARPIVHAYCFSKAEDPTAEALARASAILGCALVNGKNGVSVHRVRDVAPKKEMLCLSFPLPRHCEFNFSRKRAMESEREKEGREDTVDMVQKRSKGVGDGT